MPSRTLERPHAPAQNRPYLRWLEKYDVQPGEEPPLGLILCADKSTEHVELLRLEQSSIRVAQYLTELPSKELLEQKLHKSIELARERLARAEHAQGDQQRLADETSSRKARDE